MLTTINLIECEQIKKIKLKSVSWSDLFENKTILYKYIADLLLDPENLLYYATQKESSKTLVETRKYIKRLIENNTINIRINDVMETIGWNKELDINNTIFQGDLAEYLMNILLDKVTNIETLISKISLKTSNSMPVYGNDNVYFDYGNDILYFGESKFYNDTNQALKRAVESLKEHSNITEISFVKNQTSSFIAENNIKREKVVEKFDELLIDDVIIKSIVFVISDDMYKKEDYEKTIINFFNSADLAIEKTAEIMMVFLPILSKNEFLSYFIERIKYE